MNENKKSKFWLIPLIIGGIILTIGIILIIKGATIKPTPELPMGSPGWFDSSVANSRANFSKRAFIITGSFLSFFGVVVALSSFVIKAGKKLANNMITARKEQISREEAKQYCKYCGTKFDEGENECHSCGAKRTK